MTAARTYIQVLLPVKLRWIPTYASPVPLDPGRRVSVELGKRRYDGVVWRLLDRPDLPPERIQDILAVQDGLPAVTAEELRFWEFLSNYYLCTLGEVYKAAYPLPALRRPGHPHAGLQREGFHPAPGVRAGKLHRPRPGAAAGRFYPAQARAGHVFIPARNRSGKNPRGNVISLPSCRW